MNKPIWRAINFIQIYAYSVIIWGSMLHHLGISAENAPSLVACLGISVGAGVKIIEEGDKSFGTRAYTIKQALLLALKAPFELRKLVLR